MTAQEVMQNGGNQLNTGRIKESAEKLGTDVKEVGAQVWDQAKVAMEGAKCAAQDVIESGKKAVKENIGDYEAMIPNIKTYVCQNPIKSLLIGVGTIVIASRAMKR